MKRSKDVVLYKITNDGRSPTTYFEWSLPSKGNPGDWHEVNPGPLVRCAHGFHLTDDPKSYYSRGAEVWRVETEGEVQQFNHEFVARKVRLVARLTPDELDKLDVGVERSWRAGPRGIRSNIRKRIPKGPSPVVNLISLVYDYAMAAGKHKGGNDHSSCVHDAWKLALKGEMEFALKDFDHLSMTYDMPWLSNEHVYSELVKSGNTSGCLAWEYWRSRTPWMWCGARLHVGATLLWNMRTVQITSIDDENETFIACAYAPRAHDDNGHVRTTEKVEKRYRITREDLSKYGKLKRIGDAFQEKIKETVDLLKAADAKVDLRLIAMWSDEDVAAARTWAQLVTVDRGKARLAPVDPPPCVPLAVVATKAHNDLEEKALEVWKKKKFFGRPKPVTGTEVDIAKEAIFAWGEAKFVGRPADYLPKKRGKAA